MVKNVKGGGGGGGGVCRWSKRREEEERESDFKAPCVSIETVVSKYEREMENGTWSCLRFPLSERSERTDRIAVVWGSKVIGGSGITLSLKESARTFSRCLLFFFLSFSLFPFSLRSPSASFSQSLSRISFLTGSSM